MLIKYSLRRSIIGSIGLQENSPNYSYPNLIMFGRAISSGIEDGFKMLRGFLFKRYMSHKYEFRSIVPVDRRNYFYIPREQWKQQKEQFKYYHTRFYIALFIMGFGISDFLYALTHNPKESYRLYVSYPKLTKKVDNILQNEEVKAWLDVGKDFWVRDFVQFRLFWTRVYRLLYQKSMQQKVRISEQKAHQFKSQIKQMDRKYPIYRQQQKQSVF